jgi:hypothetical protein
LLNAIDSYFELVQSRLASINPDRKVIGIMDAMDWPADPVISNAFYLLTLPARHTGKEFWSKAVPTFTHALQWTWIVIGSDLTKNKVGRNRGDRYRVNMTMREELIKASWPWYTEKQQFTVQGSSPSGLIVKAASLTPKEYIWFTELSFLNKIDRDSGTLYGTATLYLTDMEDAIAS